MMKFNYYLPFFAGFYESVFENCDTEYYAIKEECEYYNQENGTEYTDDDFDFDYKQRRQDIIDSFVEVFKNSAPDVVSDVEFDELVSPRYYNFETDKVACDVTLDDNWRDVFNTFFSDNYDWLKERIDSEWSDRDGFWSFMPNDIEEWKKDINSDEPDERILMEVIKYMMIIDNKNIRDYIWMDTLEDIYDGYYVSLKKETEETEA